MRKITPLMFLTLMSLGGCASGLQTVPYMSNQSRIVLKQNAIYDTPKAAAQTAQNYCSQYGSEAINQGQDISGGYRFFTFDCVNPKAKPSTFQPPQPTYQPLPIVSIDDAKKKCADLGFKAGTEQFGNCVLKLSK
jgi:hypothetical protein